MSGPVFLSREIASGERKTLPVLMRSFLSEQMPAGLQMTIFGRFSVLSET